MDNTVIDFLSAQAKRLELAAPAQALEGGGGGDHTDGMEARINDLTADVRGLRTEVSGNFKWTVTAIGGACFAGLLAIGAMYLRFDGQFNGLDRRMTVIESRLERMDTKLDILVNQLPPASSRPISP